MCCSSLSSYYQRGRTIEMTCVTYINPLNLTLRSVPLLTLSSCIIMIEAYTVLYLSYTALYHGDGLSFDGVQRCHASEIVVSTIKKLKLFF